MFLGVESRTAHATAVLIGPSGTIDSTATHNGSDSASAASAAVRAVLAGRAPAGAGLTVNEPSSDASEALAAAVAKISATDAAHLVAPGAAFALAEQWCGAAHGAKNVVTFSVSDSVCAGIIIDGVLLAGAHGMAGAAAWFALNPVEREDYRKLGCLEAEVGEAGIVRRLVWRIKAGDRSRALDLAGGALAGITAHHVFDAARAGDGVAISVVRDTAKYLGMALANLVAVVDPDIVVVGGLMATAGDLLLDASRTEMLRRVPLPVAGVPLVPGALGEHAAAIGAARAAMLARS